MLLLLFYLYLSNRPRGKDILASLQISEIIIVGEHFLASFQVNRIG